VVNIGSGVPDIGTGFTASAWVKPDVTNAYMRVLTRAGGSGYGYSFACRTSGKFWGVIHTANGYFGTADSTTSMTTSWTNLTMTYNGSQLLLYINGVLDKTTNVTGGNIDWDTGNLNIGSDGSERFNGSIDDTRIYNRALSSTEITTLYNGTNPTAGTYTLSDNLSVAGDLGIRTGGLDVSANNYSINASGSFYNASNFNARAGSVNLTSTTTGNIVSSGAQFNDLSVNNGLVGYWNMNEGSGNTIGDLPGNAISGTLTGTAAWTSTVKDSSYYGRHKSARFY
jgi:hypothetical protein